MKVLVCGGRDYQDWDKVRAVLDDMSGITLVIHGGARGADTLASRWADEAGVPVEVYPADWAKDGRKAGPRRNERMLVEARPDLVVAFPGGKGTADMVKRAVEAGVEVWTP